MEILKMDYNDIDLSMIDRAIDVMLDGGVIIYPTDTIYGLGVNVFDIGAVNRVYALKMRDSFKPISVCCHSIQSISYLTDLDQRNRLILEKYLPGPFTFVLYKKNIVPRVLTKNSNKIGVRIPNNDIAIELSRIFPITTTSANLSSEKTLDTPKKIAKQLDFRVDLAIDAGSLKSEYSSTVVDLTKRTPEILREGLGNFDF